ncbi:MAG: oligoendopeptidase F, partial [Mangrovicoccus sp.]
MRLNQPVFDAAPSQGSDGFGNLPEWDLTDLYPAPDAPELTSDLEALAKACDSFAADYTGKLATLDAAGLLEAVQRYETISSLAGRVMSFARLRQAQE